MSLQWGKQTASSAGQYAASLGSNPAGSLPDIKALEHAEPHYGTHAVQQSAASLLQWVQAQSLGQGSVGSLTEAATRELSKILRHCACDEHTRQGLCTLHELMLYS